MPLQYYRTQLEPVCIENGISNILLITPETSAHRIRQVDEFSNGFIYLVASNTITGGASGLALQTDYYKRIRDQQLKNPYLIGFGVQDKEAFEIACKYGKGAIIGSAFIKHISQYGVEKKTIKDFVDSFTKK